MARYSRFDGEVIEHFDTLEELEESKKRDAAKGSYLGAFLLSILGVALTYFAFNRLGFADAPKWVKAAAILFTAVPLGFIGYKFGGLLLGILIWIGIAFLLWVAFSFGWSLL